MGTSITAEKLGYYDFPSQEDKLCPSILNSSSSGLKSNGMTNVFAVYVERKAEISKIIL